MSTSDAPSASRGPSEPTPTEQPPASPHASSSPTPGEAEGDLALLKASAQGDREAFRVLVQRHQRAILALTHRLLRDEHAAEDAAQETFLRAFRSAEDFDGRTAKVTTWLHRIAVNLCRDRLRRRRRRPLRLVGRPPEPPPSTPGEDALEQRERIERVRQAVDALPQRQRTAVILHRYQGMPHEEVAQVLGVSRGAVESLLVRAYAALRKSLGPQG